jgi:hypothetical protein
MDAAVEEEPLVEAADATELSGGGTGVDAVGAEVFEEGGDVLLDGGEEDSLAGFEELGEGFQVAIVGFAGEGAQAFFDAQVSPVFAEQGEIARGFHADSIMGLGWVGWDGEGGAKNHIQHGIKFIT